MASPNYYPSYSQYRDPKQYPNQQQHYQPQSSASAYYSSPASASIKAGASNSYSSASQDSYEVAPNLNFPNKLTLCHRTRYHCLYYGCQDDKREFRRKADLERHVDSLHNRDQQPHIDCLEPKCHRKGQFGFLRKDKMIEHMRDVHKADIPKRSPGKKSPQ